jgi:alpha-glucuronidase
MVNQWDNMRADGPMGPVERGYAGASIFYADGAVREDRGRVRDYARLLASVGVNALSLNNVNVHADESRLLTDHLPDVADLAGVLREFGIATYLSVNFAAPIELGGLGTADPMDPQVIAWWRAATDRVYASVPDLGGYVVKADSENRPGPFSYGRDHADGANLLAAALAPHGGLVFWRCFVYDHTQDWRDRSTDRARAAYDHFTPLDGRFADNVVLQVKNGPMDFQVREPVSPLIGALERTNVAVEFQITQEYTGQQRHVCYLVPQWKEVLDFPTQAGGAATVREITAGRTFGRPVSGVCAVSNVGDDPTWTGHPLAQANLFGYGRLAWDPALAADEILDEWLRLTFPYSAEVRSVVGEIMRDSWSTYEKYTAPLGVGWMVTPGSHYGPSVDGYEYTPWGTYHFADRDGIGVDRTTATGTGFAGQYREPWSSVYEDPATCPEELLLFFHHLPYEHRLPSGRTVVQHVYDTHFEGVEEVEEMIARWDGIRDAVEPRVAAEISARLAEQLRSAVEWRDQVNTYFLRKSGVPDERGRTIH